MTGSSARSTAGAETSSFVTQPEPTSEAPSANHLDIGGAPVENVPVFDFRLQYRHAELECRLGKPPG